MLHGWCNAEFTYLQKLDARGLILSVERFPMAKPGDRIRLLAMPDDPCPIPEGATGTIEYAHQQIECGRPWTQYGVKWDAPNEKRTLHVCSPPDQFEVIT